MADLPAIRITAVDQASAVIGGVGRSLGAFAAQVASVGAVIESMRRALNLGDELKRMADTTGLAVGKLDQLSIIASQNDTSLEGMAKAFKFLTSSMVEAQRGTSQSGQLFAALGVAVKDASGNLRGVDDVMGEVADALNTIDNETTRTAAGVAIFGKGYLEVAAALRNFRESQEVANQVLERYGGVSATAAKLSDELKDKLDVMAQGSKRALLEGLVPGIAAVIAALDKLTAAGGTATQGLGQFFSWIATIGAKGLIDLADFASKAGTAIAAMAASIATHSLQPLRELNAEIAQLEAKRQGAIAAISTAAKFPGLDDSDQASRAAGAQDRLNQARADAKRIADVLRPAEAALADRYAELAKQLELAAAKQNDLGERGKSRSNCSSCRPAPSRNARRS